MSVIKPPYSVKKKPVAKPSRSFFGTMMHKIDSVLESGPKMLISGPRGTTSPGSMKVKKKTPPPPLKRK